MIEKISLAEFARRVGVSLTAARKALELGRIVRDPDTKLINWKTQEKAWHENKNPAFDRAHNDPHGRRKNTQNETPEESDAYSVARSKRIESEYKAKLKQLEYEEKSGKLIEKDFVKSVVFRFGKQVRDSVLNIPERVSAVYASQITDMLKEVLRKNLNEKLADAVMSELPQKEFENISRRVWATESRIVLETIERGAKF